MKGALVDTLVRGLLFGGLLVWALGLNLRVYEQARAFPSGWVLVGVAFAALIAAGLAGERRSALAVIGRTLGGAGAGLLLAAAIFALELFTSARGWPAGPVFEALGAVFVAGALFALRRARWVALSIGLAVVSLSAVARLPRAVQREPPSNAVVERLATEQLTADGAPVRVVAFTVDGVRDENATRTYDWTATVELTSDGYYSVCPAEHVREGYVRTPLQNPENATPCTSRALPKGTRDEHKGTTYFGFREGVGWVGPDNRTH